MANTFELAQKFLPILDEVYMKESKSSALETRDGVLFTGANTIKLYETNMEGLGDYDRQNGFVTGDVNGSWNPYTLEIDRGRSFTIDVMDNDETLGMAFGTLTGEFLRTKVVPENDAYTFAKIAGTDGISHGTHDALADITDATEELDKGIAQLNEDEVPDTDRLCYVSEKFYQKIQGAVTKSITNTETNVNKTIEVYDGLQIIRVPQRRFLSAITLYNGKGAQKAGGYVPASTNYDLHFVMLHKPAVKKVTKHAVLRIFDPAVNQQADAYKVDYRAYYDAFVMKNKKKGIYFLRSDVANT